MFSSVYEDSFGGQFWFISTIIQFYLVFYLLILIKAKVNTKKYLVLSIFFSIIYTIIIEIIGKTNIRIWNSFFFKYLWEFSLGMIFAEQYYKDNSYYLKKPNMFLLFVLTFMGGIIFGASGYLGGVFKFINDPFSMLGYGGFAILIYFFNIKYLNLFFKWICKFSYEWYLTHILVFKCMEYILKDYIPSIIVFITVFILSIVVATLFNWMSKKWLSYN